MPRRLRPPTPAALPPALLLAALVGAAPRAGAQPAPAVRPADTAACAVPAGQLAMDGDERAGVLVTLTGAEGDAAARFRAWNVDVRLEPGRPAASAAARAADARGEGRGGPAEVRLTRAADGAAELTSRLRASGQRLPTAWLTAPASAAPGGLRVRLTGVTVAGQRLTFPEPAEAGEEQAAALAADVCQLAAERADAARRLAELEALDRRKLAAAFELARLGDQGRVLDARLAAARRRLALLTARTARAAQPTEELTLRAERAEVLAGDEAASSPTPAPPSAGATRP